MSDKKPVSVFDPYAIKQVEFRNRVIRSSMGGRTSYYDGTVTPAWKNFEKLFAEHKVGGIISATIDVDDQRLSPLEYPKISDDRFVKPLKKGVDAVQAHCPYIIQLGDPGGHTQTSLLSEEADAKSASAYFDLFYGYRNRTIAMTVAEIKDEVRKFRDGARRVKETGAQGVEVTASKGYIIHQFLNPATNRRKDAYGGSEWKRFQLLREVVEAVREEVGPDYLFGVRLSAKDYNYLPFWTFRMPPVLPLRNWYMGNEEDVTLEYGKELKKLGVDFLHIDLGFGFINPKGSPSCGYPIEGIRIFANATRHLGAKAWIRAAAVNVAPRWLLGIGWKYDEVPDASFARRFRDNVQLPVIANGGFQRRSDIERALQGDCDLVAIARPLLANPNLMEQFEKGLDKPENACTFCSQCCTRTAVLPLGCYDLTRFGWPDDPLELAQARMEKQILEFSANHSD